MLGTRLEVQVEGVSHRQVVLFGDSNQTRAVTLRNTDGRPVQLNLRADIVPMMAPPPVGSRLMDARHVAGVVIPHVWDESYVPTTRLLCDILADIVAHGMEYPTHGTNCICMDEFCRELTLQVSKAIPPDTGASQAVHDRLDGRIRIAHVLNMIVRKL